MKVDVILEAGTSAADLLAYAQRAEASGIHGLWVSSFPGRRDPFLTLTTVAQATGRLRLGVMPISPYEMHPLKMAEQLYTLNELCGGRAQVLVGGLGKSVMNATTLQPVRRVRAVRECVEILKLFGGERDLDYQGEVFQVRSPPFAGARLPRPRVYVAANGPQMLRMAGRVADGVMMSDVTAAHLPECLSALGRGLAETGVTGAFRVNNFWAWHVKPELQAAMDEARMELVWRGVLQRWHIEPFLAPEDVALVEQNWPAFLHAFVARTPRIENIPDRVVDALVDGLTLTGSLDDLEPILHKIRSLEAGGMNEIALRLHGDPDLAIEAIGAHICPAVG